MARTERSSVSVSPRGLGGRDVDLSVVWLRGEHDIATASKLARTLAWAVALDDTDLVVDLSGVRFMGAETIGAIVGTRNALVLQSRSLTLRSPSTLAQRVVELCGLADLIDPPTGASLERDAPGALDSWVAVPATGRVDLAVVTSPKTVHGDDREGAGLPIATGSRPSAAARERADALATNVAGRGGP
jgi:anti-anti-sigma factor